MTQTAVQYLLDYIEQRIYKVNKLDDGTYLDENIYLSLPKDEFEKIKKESNSMNKKQIMNAFLDGKINNNKDFAIEYYNQTYTNGL
jgi:hypothetical protein